MTTNDKRPEQIAEAVRLVMNLAGDLHVDAFTEGERASAERWVKVADIARSLWLATETATGQPTETE